MEKFEIVKYASELKTKILSIEKVINPENLKNQIKDLEDIMLKPTFWDEADNATKVINEANAYKETLSSFKELEDYLEELQMMLELDDAELYQEADSFIKKVDKSLHDFEEKLLLNGEYDKNNAIVELHPGAGAQLVRSAGTSAQILGREGKYVLIRLASGEVRKVLGACRATIGEVGNADHMNVNIGKAGRTRHMGIRPTVRGSVMNPNDHPHGGGEGRAPIGRKGPVTPWGKPALGYKTRKKNKASNQYIVKRRNEK